MGEEKVWVWESFESFVTLEYSGKFCNTGFFVVALLHVQLWGSSVSIIYYLITVTVVQLAMGQKYFQLSQSSPKFLQAELVCNEDFFLSPFFFFFIRTMQKIWITLPS